MSLPLEQCSQFVLSGLRRVIVASLPVAIFAAANVVATLGTFWMMYVAIHEEKPPWPMFRLAFVPFSSLWYYFELMRPRRLRSLSSRRLSDQSKPMTPVRPILFRPVLWWC
jgi:hypothetical protein